MCRGGSIRSLSIEVTNEEDEEDICIFDFEETYIYLKMMRQIIGGIVPNSYRIRYEESDKKRRRDAD